MQVKPLKQLTIASICNYKLMQWLARPKSQRFLPKMERGNL